MIKQYILGLGILLLLAFLPVPISAADINCYSCPDCNAKIQAASPGDIVYLQNSITSDATCINFGGKDNITLDCQDYTITDLSPASFEYGINFGDFSGSNYNTVQNCKINDFHLGIQGSTKYSNFINITTSANTYGFSIEANYSTFTNIIDDTDDYCGIQLFGNYNTLNNIEIHDINGNGLVLETSHTKITNLTSYNNRIGIYIVNVISASYNNISDSIFYGNSKTGLEISTTGYPSVGNVIWNCLFNNSGSKGNIHYSEIANIDAYFNTTKQLGTRIFSNGSYIGGNYWTNPSGVGYSDTCIDSDADGFCDTPFNTASETGGCSSSNKCDRLPLSDEGPADVNNPNIRGKLKYTISFKSILLKILRSIL